VANKPVDHSSNIEPKCSLTVKPKRRCFRISGIPQSWDKDTVVAEIQEKDPAFKDQKHQLRLFPSCTNANQTAVLNIDECTSEYFSNINVDRPTQLEVDNLDDEFLCLKIDRDFYDMTPLNVSEGEILAEFVTYPHLFMEGEFWILMALSL
jgi:hypothetical protein